MMEDNNNGMLGEVLGALINNGGENKFGGNWMWVIFIVFMMMWGGGYGGFGFGNRGFLGAGTNLATQGDVAATAAWGQTQDAIRDSIENTTNTVGRLSQDVNALNNSVNQLGYNTLAQSNATNQQVANTGFDIQTAILQGNNLLQGAIMGGNNLLNSAIRETAGDTKLTICQGNSALQGIIQGTGNDITTAVYQSGNATQRQLQDVGYGVTNAIYQTSNNTQRDIQTLNGDSRLAICQATNAVQNTTNENGNRIATAIGTTGNSIIQGITNLGFLTQTKSDELKFELAKSTCAITSNETANTQKVLDKLCQMESNMQATRIQELQVANQALALSNQVKDLQAANLANTGFIINSLRPYPVPAYTVSSPYGTTTTTPTTGA